MTVQGPWRVVRTAPGEFSEPDGLGDRWDTPDLTLPTPSTIASAAGAEHETARLDPDDHDWWVSASVSLDEDSVIEFTGLTFPATVFVDGHAHTEGESMFLPVSLALDGGDHEIAIRFGSLRRWTKQTRRPRGRWRSGLVAEQGLRWSRTTLIGRAPVYGTLPAPIGFWRPVTVIPTHRAVTMLIEPDLAGGRVSVVVRGHAAPDTALTVAVVDPRGDVVATQILHLDPDGRGTATLAVPDPEPWWPNGFGSQPLYRVELTPTDEQDGHPLQSRAFGFRSVSVDESDSGFRVIVNGERIFCRGVTWTPPDPVALHVDGHTMRAHLERFADAGATMIRVVGGMVFEQDEFWTECARLGLLVWQDAMIATFDPPDELSDVVAREVRTLCERVSGNPALVVISGGSETIQQPEMLGRPIADTTIETLDTALPAVAADHGPVPYVRASPSAPPNSTDLAIRPDTGVAHWFGVGGYLRPVDDVRSAHVRFAAESLAFANPPSTDYVERHFGSAAVAGHDPRWKQGVPRDRGASWDFEDIRDHYVREIFGVDPLATRRIDPERYLQLGRLAIAEAMAACFAHWRRPDSGCAGALVLSSKDLTPGAGWGLLDSDGDPKVALAVLARVWAPVTVVATSDGLSGICADLHNDTGDDVDATLSMIGTSSSGHRVVDHGVEVSIPGRGSLTLHDSDVTGAFGDLSHAFRFGRPAVDAVEFTLTSTDGTRFGRDVVVVDACTGQRNSGLFALTDEIDSDHVDLRVGADVALRYVGIDAPGWDCADNHFHLVAGSEHRIRLTRADATGRCAGTVSSIDAVSAAPFRGAV